MKTGTGIQVGNIPLGKWILNDVPGRRAAIVDAVGGGVNCHIEEVAVGGVPFPRPLEGRDQGRGGLGKVPDLFNG